MPIRRKLLHRGVIGCARPGRDMERGLRFSFQQRSVFPCLSKSEDIVLTFNNLFSNEKDFSTHAVPMLHERMGTRCDCEESPAAPAVLAETAPSANAQPLTDADLLKMAGVQAGTPQYEMIRKAKRLKRAGWISGGIMLAAGALITGCFDSFDDEIYGLTVGPLLMGGGIITTTACLVRAKNLKKKASRLPVASAPLYQQDFKLKNGTTLSPSLDILKDNTQRNTTFGVGLTYNF